jgi:hypothetical protein
MKGDLPIYDIVIKDDDQGVGMISLVDVPAIGVDWIALRNQPRKVMAKRLKKVNSLMAKPECLGCPPNGDGTRVNGEPDRRCKGDGADKGGGAKAPTKVDTVRDDATMRKDLLNYDAENSKDYGQDRRKLDGSKTTQAGAPAVKLNDTEVAKLKDRMNKSVRTPEGNVKVFMSPGGMSKNSEPFHDGEKLTNAGFVKVMTETYSVRNNNVGVTDEHIGYWNPKTNEIIAKDGPGSRGYNTSSKIASIFN